MTERTITDGLREAVEGAEELALQLSPVRTARTEQNINTAHEMAERLKIHLRNLALATPHYDDLCGCGHAARWHADLPDAPGTGDCEHNPDCGCQEFTRAPGLAQMVLMECDGIAAAWSQTDPENPDSARSLIRCIRTSEERLTAAAHQALATSPQQEQARCGGSGVLSGSGLTEVQRLNLALEGKEAQLDGLPSPTLWAALNDPERAAEDLPPGEQEAYRAAQESVLAARGFTVPDPPVVPEQVEDATNLASPAPDTSSGPDSCEQVEDDGWPPEVWVSLSPWGVHLAHLHKPMKIDGHETRRYAPTEPSYGGEGT